MPVYTENPEFAATLLPEELAEAFSRVARVDTELDSLLTRLSGSDSASFFAAQESLPLSPLLISELVPASNYQELLDLLRQGWTLPDRFAYLAGSGDGFHGFKGRSWAALPGNIHLAVHLAPGRQVERFGPAFIALATVSVVDALDATPGMEGRAGIKWVNDVLVDGAKVAGSLAFTQSQDHTVTSAVLGIGINVLATPQVERAPFVPRVGSIRDVLGADTPSAWDVAGDEVIPTGDSAKGDAPSSRGHAPSLLRLVFQNLLSALENNYRGLLENGADSLVSRYRERCMIVGEDVTVYGDRSHGAQDVLAEGRVEALGENLELILRGQAEPITSGRLVLQKAMEREEHRVGAPRGNPPVHLSRDGSHIDLRTPLPWGDLHGRKG